MTQVVRLDGADLDLDRLSVAARQILERLQFVQQRLQELQDQQALLTKAKRAYIADLKAELLQSVPQHGQGGARLGSFLRDDDIDTL
jgi:hypothetical protein